MFGLYARLGIGIAVLLFLAWVARIENRRAHWQHTYETLTTAVADTTCTEQVVKADPKCRDKVLANPAEGVAFIGRKRDQYQRERDDARIVVEQQSQSIRTLEAQSAEAMRLAKVQLVATQRIAAERDRWIAKAQEASKRTTRLSDAQELKQIEEAQDALFDAGF